MSVLDGVLVSAGGGGGGTGDVVGPAASVDGNLASFDGLTGKLLKDSGIASASVIAGSTGATDNALLLASGAGGSTAKASTVWSLSAAALSANVTASITTTGVNSDLTIAANRTLNLGAPAAIFGQEVILASTGVLNWSVGAATSARDTGLSRIAAGQVAMKNVTNGMANNIKIATTTVNASGATSTATNLVPAGCILLGVTTRVTTAITSGDGGTSVDIGNGTDAAMYGNDIAFTLDTTTNLASHTASALAWKAAAESVVFTCVGGTFATGQWRVCAHYLDLTAPTS